MRVFSCLSVAAVSVFALLGATSAADNPPKYSPMLNRDMHAGSLTIQYQTPDLHGKNWVGLYPLNEGPVQHRKDGESLMWKYAPRNDGILWFDVSSLAAGNYTVYFLAKDGYSWLTDPIDITLSTYPEIYFPVAEATLRNGRQGEAYEARLHGLLLGKHEKNVRFEKMEGDDWITVHADGTLQGIPSQAGPSHVTVRGVAENDVTSTIKLTIPVREGAKRLLDSVRTMSLNIWHGGAELNDALTKQLWVILKSNVDVVALQESENGAATRIATALGWDYWESSFSVSILSRYPIVQKYGAVSRSGAARVNLNGEKAEKIHLNVWNAHLGYTPYGPYDACRGEKDWAGVLEGEKKSGRVDQINEIMAGMKLHLDDADNVPVLLMGDFNAPSQLDYVESLKEQHCGLVGVEWPTSKAPLDNGLMDSFRETHQIPAANEVTWSPLYPRQDGVSGDFEPQDRIDFIYYKGKKLKVKKTQVFDQWSPSPYPTHKDNGWPSDHKAAFAEFNL
ncbi:hypothetical protein P168DRAFT_289353 [Aspergillus campestris IBT 28561]|uniref:Endonuclease/exonuclease/phosphatase domain-containing protein n=1 Tax=Aspergillus campestris (strain IBT 28561) TaxID=1392248 RepID=A0A2I1D7W3_ASPC2|nr:uncharacterized protein P168DRAFT_289353 [Aspergillus campestris IBT 28561]PKY05947.1 hypothetical protein P168DRAFT_289353 [Aspergillus campestris IBT 28561]